MKAHPVKQGYKFSIGTVKVKALGLYLFSLILIYLAGSYFGGIILFLFYCFAFLPVFSFIFLIIAFKGVKFSQFFSTDHPVKGEHIEYKVILSNESIVPVSEITSTFVIINPLMRSMIPDFKLSLKKGESREFVYTITCSFRGIYHVGLDSIQITDIMNLFTIHIPVWHRTFYVYPKIIRLTSFTPGTESFLNKGLNTGLSGLSDNTLIKGIREYQQQDSIRHMYWKKYASTGIPVLKEFDLSTSPGISIYPDLYNDVKEHKTIRALEREDVSVEIVTALAVYYLQKNIPVIIRSPCNPLFHFSGHREEHFKLFYKKTIKLFSYAHKNIIDLLKVDIQNGIVESKSIIIITHRTDADIFNFVEESIPAELQVIVIFNHTTGEKEVQKKNKRFFNTLRDKGACIIEVYSGSTIKEDMEKYGTLHVF